MNKDKARMQNGSYLEKESKSFCTFCKNVAFCVCERCGDFYCSQECQRMDWQNHRYICMTMPPLVSASVRCAANRPQNISRASASNDSASVKSTASSGKANFPIQSQTSTMPRPNSRVLITGFRSANRCFVRALTDMEDTSYLINAKKIDAYGKTAPTLRVAPKVNSHAIASLEGVMQRVQVLAAHQNSFRVLFYDLGETAVRKLGDLREISKEIMHLPQHAKMVQLLNVKNFACSNKVLTFLSRFVNMDFKITYEPHQRNNEVKLFNWNTEKCLNEEILNFCSDLEVFAANSAVTKNQNIGTVQSKVAVEPVETKHEKSENLDSIKIPIKNEPKVLPVMNPPFETIMLPVGSTNVQAILLDTSALREGYIGCISQLDVPQFIFVQKYLAEYVDTKKAYKPKLLEYCLAKFEGDWYRAKVLDFKDLDTYTVVYIDFSNLGSVTSADIRHYPDNLKWNCTTNLCVINGLPDILTDKQIEYIKKELPLQSKFTINKVTNCDEDTILIQCDILIQKMREDKLLD